MPQKKKGEGRAYVDNTVGRGPVYDKIGTSNGVGERC